MSLVVAGVIIVDVTSPYQIVFKPLPVEPPAINGRGGVKSDAPNDVLVPSFAVAASVILLPTGLKIRFATSAAARENAVLSVQIELVGDIVMA